MLRSAKQICASFTQSLEERINEVRHFGVMPNDHDWMEKFLILFALEECQGGFVEENSQKPYCRFSMGLSTDKAKAELQEYLKHLRNRRLERKYNKVAASMLRESLVDFSLSNYSLPQVRGDQRRTAMPEGAKFELLMIAESEMGTKNQVLEDFIKLTSVESHFKMMIYKARKRKADREALKQGFEQIIVRARRPHDAAQWLFLGVPGYREWIQAENDRSGLTIQVMNTKFNECKLVECDEWWTWLD